VNGVVVHATVPGIRGTNDEMLLSHQQQEEAGAIVRQQPAAVVSVLAVIARLRFP
jgi:hypothetical protein